MKESITPTAQSHVGMQAESTSAYDTSTCADGSAEYRQRGRALKMRRWAAEGRKDAESSARDKAAAMAHKHKAALDRIRLEQELEKRRCQLCDLVRAQAWGLGHRNWAERRCGRCWAQHAKTQSDEQLLQNMNYSRPRAKSADGSLYKSPQNIDILSSHTQLNSSRIPGILLDYFGLHHSSVPGNDACLHSGLQRHSQHQYRSVRMSQLRSEPEEAATANTFGCHSTACNADHQGSLGLSQCSAAQMGTENASPSCSDDEVNTTNNICCSAGMQPKQLGKQKPGGSGDVYGHSNTNSQNIERLLGNVDPRLLLQCIQHVRSSPDNSPATHAHGTSFRMSQDAKHSLARLTARQAHKELRASESAWLSGEAGYTSHSRRQGMRDASNNSRKDGQGVRNRQSQQQPAAFSTNCATTHTADSSGIANALNVPSSAMANALIDAIQQKQPGSGMQRTSQQQSNSIQHCMQSGNNSQAADVGASNTKSRQRDSHKRRDGMFDYTMQHEEALQREGSLMLELEKWENELVFARTQAERTAALFQAVQLREELAVLGRTNRRYRKAIQTRKNLLRDPVCHANSPEIDRTVLGRDIPIETALGPATRRQQPRKALPWTAAAVNRILEQQMQHELTPQVTACALPSRNGSIVAEQHTDGNDSAYHYLGHDTMPKHGWNDQEVDHAQKAGRRHEQHTTNPWHERLSYSTKAHRQTRQKLVLSLDQLSAVQAVLHEYRELQDLRPPVEPVGLHAQMRARAHGQYVHTPSQSLTSAPEPSLCYRQTGVPHSDAEVDDGDGFRIMHSLDELNGMKSRKLVTAIKQLVRDTHPAYPDERLMVDQVTWRPSAMHSKPPVHTAGLCSVGDWDGLNPMHELAKLRSMPVDDFKSQLRKKREWGAAVKQLQLSLGMES